jgi:transposase
MPERTAAAEEQKQKQEQKRGPLRFKAIDRSQMEWRTFAVDSLLVPDHPARAIWEFLDGVDLSGFEAGLKVAAGRAGQSAYPPQMLIAVWLFACTEGVGSAREISRRCDYHPAYRWLCGDERVSYHTFSSFRTAHREALDRLFVETLGVLTHEGLVTLEQVMHDGTKIRAVASAHSFHREQTVERCLAEAEKQVQSLGDPEQDPANRRTEAARKRAAEQRRTRLQQARAQLEHIREGKAAKEQEQARVSVSEPEARIMHQPEHGFAPAYNAQLSTDAEHGMIVNVALTDNGSDFPQLAPAVEQIKENFGKMPEQVVVDGG